MKYITLFLVLVFSCLTQNVQAASPTSETVITYSKKTLKPGSNFNVIINHPRSATRSENFITCDKEMFINIKVGLDCNGTKTKYSGFEELQTYGFKRSIPVAIEGLNKSEGMFTIHVRSYDKYNNLIGAEVSKSIKVTNKKFKKGEEFNGDFSKYSFEILTPEGKWTAFSDENGIVYEEGDTINYRWSIPKGAKCKLYYQVLTSEGYVPASKKVNMSSKTSGSGKVKAVYTQKNKVGGMSENYLAMDCPANKKVTGTYHSIPFQVELEQGW